MAASVSRCAVVSPTAKSPISIEEFPIEAPAEDHILVKVEFAGVCGTDPHLWQGHFPLPGDVILGHEGIGSVVALHPSVKTDHASLSLSVGDRVYWTGIRPCGKCYQCTVIDDECGCPNSFFMNTLEQARASKSTWATYTEFATLGPRNSFYRVDSAVPPEAFIALGCALPTMLQAVAHLPGGAIKPLENVVVQGAGALGLAAIMMSKVAGARKIVVIEPNKLRARKAQEFGADVLLDIDAAPEERLKQITEIFGQQGVSLIVECSGNPTAVSEGLSLLARNGKYLLLGTWAGSGTVPFDPFLAVNKAITIQGSTYAAPRDYHNAVRFVEQNYSRFPLASCVTHRFGLQETQQGLETVLKGQAVKCVITPNRG